jgi:hypothetical protein
MNWMAPVSYTPTNIDTLRHMGKQLGTSGRIMRRKELKPARQLSDEALLRNAQKQAERWATKKQKGVLHSN